MSAVKLDLDAHPSEEELCQIVDECALLTAASLGMGRRARWRAICEMTRVELQGVTHFTKSVFPADRFDVTGSYLISAA